MSAPQPERERLALTPLAIALSGVLIAVVFVATRFIQVPIPSGYIHLGDIAIYTGAFLFGPLVGGISGALGPMLADLTSGYGQYAPATFVLHGLQGFLAGWIGWRAGVWRMILATVIGGVIIVAGYFLWEIAVLRIGLATATANIPFNLWQVVSGAVGGIALTVLFRETFGVALARLSPGRFRREA
ncbi:Thiamine precursor transporter HmpT [bacterium HR27]|nr:Thiamine precursor transporter HmpT [bacterium HR27]